MAINSYIEPLMLEQLVYEKLREKGIRNYPINPYELIMSEGILLQETPLDNDNIRGMIVIGDNAAGIMINANRSYTSKRFIAMHELSHYWFHSHVNRVCFEKYIENSKGTEWQANNAAAYALMPKDYVIDLYYSCSGDVNFMSDVLKVSPECLSYRLKDLNLRKSSTKEYFNYFTPNNDLLVAESNWLYGGL